MTNEPTLCAASYWIILLMINNLKKTYTKLRAKMVLLYNHKAHLVLNNWTQSFYKFLINKNV